MMSFAPLFVEAPAFFTVMKAFARRGIVFCKVRSKSPFDDDAVAVTPDRIVPTVTDTAHLPNVVFVEPDICKKFLS